MGGNFKAYYKTTTVRTCGTGLRVIYIYNEIFNGIPCNEIGLNVQKWTQVSMVNLTLTRTPRSFKGRKNSFFNRWCFGNWSSARWTMRLGPYLTPYIKIKMDQRPTYRSSNYKTLRTKYRNKSFWHWIRQLFLSYDPK